MDAALFEFLEGLGGGAALGLGAVEQEGEVTLPFGHRGAVVVVDVPAAIVSLRLRQYDPSAFRKHIRAGLRQIIPASTHRGGEAEIRRDQACIMADHRKGDRLCVAVEDLGGATAGDDAPCRHVGQREIVAVAVDADGPGDALSIQGAFDQLRHPVGRVHLADGESDGLRLERDSHSKAPENRDGWFAVIAAAGESVDAPVRKSEKVAPVLDVGRERLQSRTIPAK